MAKRYVEECDLCKKEAELDNSLTLKPNKGKKSGRSYDLCNDCKESLEKALISREGLGSLTKAVPVINNEAPRKSRAIQEDGNTLLLPDGTTRDIPSRQEIEKGAGDDPGSFAENPLEAKGEGCIHMNKSRPRINAETNHVYQQCRDCGEVLPYRSARQKAQELNVRPHTGVSLKTHASEERRRDD